MDGMFFSEAFIVVESVFEQMMLMEVLDLWLIFERYKLGCWFFSIICLVSFM